MPPSHGGRTRVARAAAVGHSSVLTSQILAPTPRARTSPGPRLQTQFGLFRVFCACLDARWTPRMVPKRLRASCARCRARSAVRHVVGAQASRFGAAFRQPRGHPKTLNLCLVPGPRPARSPDPSPEAARASRHATSRRCAAAKPEKTIKASEKTIVLRAAARSISAPSSSYDTIK